MFCGKCGAENLEVNRFCKICGAKLDKIEEARLEKENITPPYNSVQQNEFNRPVPPPYGVQNNYQTRHSGAENANTGGFKSPKKPFKKPNKKLIIIFAAGAVLLIAAILVIGILTGPKMKFLRAIDASDSVKAESIYKLADDKNGKPSIESAIIERAEKNEKDFYNENKSYDEIAKDLETLKKTKIKSNSITEIQRRVYDVKVSRDALVEAYGYINEENWESAVDSLLKVVESDKNYEIAVNCIEGIKPDYRKEMLEKANNAIVEGNYLNCISLLNKLDKVFPNDPEQNWLRNVCNQKTDEEQKAQTDAKIKKLKDDQPIVVTKVRVNSGKLFVTIKNNSGKTLKRYSLVAVEFDADGKQIEVSENAIKKLGASNSTVAPGSYDGGKNYYWDINYNTASVKVIVDSAEYTDGTKYYNDYTVFWLDEVLQK